MANGLTPEERERLLVKASEDFMSGKLSVDGFEEAEKKYMLDYKAAASALARLNDDSLLRRLFRNVLRP